ncbi:MAG: hypothetical protein H9Q67_07390, partial [Spiroplasma ixodetis]|nr:hypothetical protein [Spiroplasma ixodetis]
IVCHNPADSTVYEPVLYRGKNAAKHFWQNIKKEVEQIGEVYKTNKPYLLTVNERAELYKRAVCHICGAKWADPQRMHVDHCHLTGTVRGLACPTCNEDYILPNFVPIVFHNGSRY